MLYSVEVVRKVKPIQATCIACLHQPVLLVWGHMYSVVVKFDGLGSGVVI